MFNSLIQEGTEDTPELHLDKTSNTFKISGRSYPENAQEFYQPVMEWLELYGKDPNPSTNLEIDLEYFNSGSVKMVFGLLYLIEDIMESGKEAKITWTYRSGDELMMQKGLEFQKFLQVPVEVIERT